MGPNFDLTAILSSGFLWVIWAVSVLVYAVISWVLVYHWDKYSYAPRRVAQVKKLYFSVSGILVVIMAIALFILSNSG